jgi:hypothetical protein
LGRRPLEAKIKKSLSRPTYEKRIKKIEVKRVPTEFMRNSTEIPKRGCGYGFGSVVFTDFR